MTKKIYSIKDIKKILKEIFSNTDVEKAILFGSYAKNTQTKNSDIDILIDSDGKIKGLKFFAIIDIIREKFDKEVDVIEKCEIEKNSRIEKEIEETGVVVYEK
ncbi:MAG: nucleotidyltransferase domain-containing protein [Clostridia bacterium]|nr:nucleotidyltransferase domain-containing protein [Clostridia bacterium]